MLERSLLMKRTVRDLMRESLFVVVILSLSSVLFAAEVTETKNDERIAIIDTHAHILRGWRPKTPFPSGANLLRAMDAYRIEMALLLPPPFLPNHPGSYGLHEIEPLLRANPGRFAFAAGGESLNPM